MSDDVPFYAPHQPPAAPRRPHPREPLWAFVRQSDKKRFECELRFHGESYGWEAQIFDQGELLTSHGAFVTRALAVQWADETRKILDAN
jgi:hypothetical protein